jgi:predicted cobalt transporter CbtA
MAYRLSLLMITLWAGALWTSGLNAYLLFDNLQDKQMAGMLARKLFTVVSYIGMVSAFYLLMQRLLQYGTAALKQGFFWAVLVMFVLVLAGHFGIQPILEGLKTQALPSDVMQSVFADRFRNWHGVASVAYLIESVLAIVMVLKAR